jgi:hypothetical protein
MVEYISLEDKVKIICSKHGFFLQTPNNHFKGRGCKLCAIEKRKLTNQQFIAACKRRNKKSYDYSKTIYNGMDNDIIIICPIHGEHICNAFCHYNGNGCNQCYIEEKHKTTEQFIKESVELFGDNFDYSKTTYINNKQPVILRCKIHNYEFEANVASHLRGQNGCPQCQVISHGEERIKNFLNKNNILYKQQVTFDECKYSNLLPFDFAILNDKKEIKLLIEYDGEHHYMPVKWSKEMTDDEANKMLIEQQEKDKIKNEFCKKYDILLYRIPYWYYGDIEHILREKLYG